LYNSKNGFPSSIDNYVYKLGNDVIFCAEKGVYQYNYEKDKFEKSAYFNKLFGENNKIRTPKLDSKGNIWFYKNDHPSVLIKKNKDLYATLIGFGNVIWLFCLLAILKHFPFQNIVFIIGILSSLILIFLHFKNKKMISSNNILFSVIVFITIFFRFLPAHNTYYLTNIKFNHEIETDYFSWDKYSWFLYTNGKVDEAIEANKNAETAVEKCLQNPKYGDENEYLSLIKEHQLAIKNKTWKKYP